MRWFVVVAVLAACSKAEPVVLGPPAQPFGLLKDVRLGMLPDEVKKLVPQLHFDKDGEMAAASPENADYEVQFDDGRVSLIRIQIMKDHRPAADLWKAWGPGVTLTGGMRHRYFDEIHDVRADLEELPAGDSFVAELASYTPLAKVLDGPDLYSLMGVQILGRPLDDVAKDLRARQLDVQIDKKDTDTYTTVEDVPETEWSGNTSSGKMSATIDVGTDGKVVEWSLSSPVFQAPDSVKQKLLAFYATKWGTPTDKGGSHVFGTGPYVRVSDEYVAPSFSLSRSY